MDKIVYIIVLFALSLSSCAKLSDCAAVSPVCLDKPPTSEACQQAFSRWFYDSDKDKCELVNYSGCNSYGFETELECNKCSCKK